jgi:hypothetical protein
MLTHSIITLSIMTHSITTLCIMMLSRMTHTVRINHSELSKTVVKCDTLHAGTQCNNPISITTFVKTTISIMTLRIITIGIRIEGDTQHNYTQHYYTEHIIKNEQDSKKMGMKLNKMSLSITLLRIMTQNNN